MVGFPRSGKTTRALELSKKLGAPIVNPDSVRLAIHGHAYMQKAEPLVWGVAKTMVNALFEAGHEEIVIDACNNTKRRRDEWRFLGDWETVFEVVKTSADICRSRTEDPDLLEVIDRMESQHEPVEEEEGPFHKMVMNR
jgi:predicted kinase